MKHIAIIAALFLSILSASAQNGKSIYQKYSGQEGVSAVYISPAMFRLIGKLPDIDTDVNLTPVIQALSGLYIIESENKEINDRLLSEAEKFVAGGRYEMLMEAKSEGSTVSMYTLGSDDVVESFVMISLSDGEVAFICLDGKMGREDLEGVLSSMSRE